ncbi:hypothetical protein [Rhodohalobacter barkolensis]|uniref:DUF748 domain-containing protein n=1 Tax=Rhodohalobacter barkolensis TaxID=2053187 RepID=A0A2N0VJG8_9BACT|nr:hypothetical protein [Rhodohalobacter barkolensis]PKD44319.1 hypothetical protein CWD77_02295 [Rhodohalobacter barkolensis]
MKKLLLILVLTFMVILFGIFTWLKYGVDQEQVQDMLASALGSDYNVEIISARVLPLQRAVSIGQMSISSSDENHTIFQTDTLLISGINPSLYFQKKIILSKIKMDTFTINWDSSPETGDNESNNESSFRKLEIESLDLTNGTIIVNKDGRESKRINDLNLNTGLQLELNSKSDSVKSLQYNVSVDSLGFLFSEDRNRLSLSGLHFENRDSLLTLSSMKLIPVGGYNQFMNSHEFEANMFDMEIVNLTASGVDPSAFQNQNILKARLLDFDSFHILVAKNKQLPDKPDKKAPTLLNKSIQNLPFAVQIDSLHFRNTNIQYSEQDEKGTRPGTISFMNSTIQLRDVNSLSSEPANLNAVTYLQNHSELKTELSFTLNDDPFHMTGTGNLQPFDLTELNSIFMDLSGMEIVSGFAHELDFNFEMVDDTSSGNMHLLYENLQMEIVDRDDYHVNFANSIKSYVANKAVVRSENLADSTHQGRTGDIDHVRDPESSFFKYLWQTLRSGIYDILLRT